jgi:RNA polymerase primary sigma factor
MAKRNVEEFINRYLNSSLKKPSSYEEAMRNVLAVEYLLNRVALLPTIDEACNVLKNNDVLRETFKIILKNHGSMMYSSDIVNTFAKANDILYGHNRNYDLSQLFESLLVSNDSYETYKNIVKNIPFLTESEEEYLGKKILEKDHMARELFILRNLRIVIPFVDYAVDQGYSALDMVQEGNLALIRAVDSYDVTLGVPFYTYARVSIRRAIRGMAFANERCIKLPLWLEPYMSKRQEVEEQLFMENGHKPTNEEIIEAMGGTSESLEMASLLSKDYVSIDELVDEEDTLGDLIPSKDEFFAEIENSNELSSNIKSLMDDSLSEREKNIISLRLGFKDGKSRTLGEIARMFDVSDSCISEIYERALRKMIRSAEASGLADYTEFPERSRDVLSQKRWKIAKDGNTYSHLDALIDILRDKLKDYTLDELKLYYNLGEIDVISYFMGFYNKKEDARSICHLKCISLENLRCLLLNIYNVYESRIKTSNKRSRIKKEEE